MSREIKILKQVNHPNIIKLYEIIESPKQLYLIMEYASGGELFDYIVARSKLKEPQACVFFQQLLAGVEYLAQIKVVHRDLKPENLLLDSEKNIKIVDFGLSNLYQRDETLKTACGSPCYAAPEMIAGKRYHGSCVDVWSCGVILFAMICGYLPFEDPNTSNLYKKILSGEYKVGTWVSTEAQDLIRRILSTNPENRLTIDMIRNHSWFHRYSVKNVKKINEIEVSKVDESVLIQMEAIGLNIEITRESLAKNKHNKYTATYYLLLKKLRNQEATESLRNKISINAGIQGNPRGESYSINPRSKQVFEFKVADTSSNASTRDHDCSYRDQNNKTQIKVMNNTVIYENKYTRPAPRRRIYGTTHTTYRDPRAASTGFQAIRAVTMYIPREPFLIPVNNAKPRNVSVVQREIPPLSVSLRNASPRAGTALDMPGAKHGPKIYSVK